ncbi:hypothetical protein SNOG_07964 [Parastagonospora nodorum SN15]|uniref:Uncharacterized protein n=1 Tax=Phaeosphaeria nodorum (strain SN15 / ATCC MYA-4574 / FGSC 10173) TaxID=321614 RepID=Q0UJV0_PHANO|nr:hypothetical protein SNOG_07964 [Parastagonospora nodorum SN15]EAT84240.1 hypothetical protein SNOG_07964 [Parastagonospora nodorum SN15]
MVNQINGVIPVLMTPAEIAPIINNGLEECQTPKQRTACFCETAKASGRPSLLAEDVSGIPYWLSEGLSGTSCAANDFTISHNSKQNTLHHDTSTSLLPRS